MNAKVARETWAMIYRLVLEGLADDRMQAACSFAGVSPAVIKTLLRLEPGDGTAMRDLAAHFGVDASYVTSLVDDLERAGLAQRTPHPVDRRVRSVRLTPRGVETQGRVRDLMWEPPGSFNVLAPAELRELHRLLARVTAAEEVAAGPRFRGRGLGPPAPASVEPPGTPAQRRARSSQ